MYVEEEMFCNKDSMLTAAELRANEVETSENENENCVDKKKQQDNHSDVPYHTNLRFSFNYTGEQSDSVNFRIGIDEIKEVNTL
jgi:hypothetical protein